MRANRCIEQYKKCYAIASVVSNCALCIERQAELHRHAWHRTESLVTIAVHVITRIYGLCEDSDPLSPGEGLILKNLCCPNTSCLR